MRRAVPAWLLIAAAELSQLRRSPSSLITAVVLPTAVGLLIVWAEEDTGKGGWGASAGLLLVTLMTFTGYVAGTTTLAARRQQVVLKRLRLAGVRDTSIVAGVLAPLALVTFVQTTVLFGVVVVVDGYPTVSPVPLLAAVGAGTTAVCVLAVMTAAFTPTPETAQLTTGPIALALCGGAFWAVGRPPGDVTWAMLALPGVSVTHLARVGWHEPGATGVAGAVAALVLLTVVITPVAVRCFGWDPRR